MLRIAAVESSELLFSPAQKSTLFLTSPASPFRSLLQSLASTVSVLEWIFHTRLVMVEEEVLLHPKTTELLHQKDIQAIWLNDWSSPTLEEWAKTNHFTLLCNAFRDQERLENKLSFDALARKHALPVPDGCTVKTIEEARNSGLFPGVLQKPESFGAMGTYFVGNPKALDALENVFDGTPLLLRKFEKGLPIGITVLVGPNRSLFSALRVQLNWIDSSEGNVHYGVQWLPRSLLPSGAVVALEQMLHRTVTALRSEGFQGLLSFDCLMTASQTLLIECNPRHSGATLQLSAHPELLHGLDYAEQCIRVFSHDDPAIDAPTIPETIFEGTSIDLDSLPIGKGADLSAVPQSGFYQLQSDGLRRTENQSIPSNSQNLFLWTQPPDEESHYRGFAFANLPLTTLSGLRCSVHPQGQSFIDALSALFRRQS
ncbi:MAG: hypothetical protein WCG83_00280 [Candidatus Peregrinibacteria bacterium]